MSNKCDVKEFSIKLSYGQAALDVFSLAGSYAVARLTVSAIILGNGIVFAKLSPAENAAGTFITTFTYSVMGFVRSVMLSTGMVAGEQYGAGEFSRIGDTVVKSWVLGGGFSIFVAMILLNTEKILLSFGVENDVAEATQNYFNGVSWGIPSIFWLASDQQVAIAVKKPNVVLLSSIGYAFLTMAVGYPLALFGMGTEGLGHGVSAAGWLSLIFLRLYYKLNASEFGRYGLFNFKIHFKIVDFYSLLRRGLALGFQNLSEWGNLLAMSIMTGIVGKQASVALQSSLQPISAFNMMLMGLSQGLGVMVSHYRGACQQAIRSSNVELAELNEKNARTIGNVGILIAFCISVAVCTMFVLLSNLLVMLFSSTQATESLGKDLLQINSLGVLPDSVRNVVNGILIGNDDPWVPPLISFMYMSLLCAPIGGAVVLYEKQSVNWLFITRNIGIALSALTLCGRWRHKSDTHAELERSPLLFSSDKVPSLDEGRLCQDHIVGEDQRTQCP